MVEREKHISSDPLPEPGASGSAPSDDQPGFTVVDKRSWVTREKEGNGLEAGAEAPASRLPTYLAQLEAQLQEKDRLLKTHVAEMRNEREELRRRLTRDFEQRVDIATGNLLADFLPILDNLDRALESAERQPNMEKLLEGIHLVRAQFLDMLGRRGLKPLDRQGQPFDPGFDEAMAMVDVKDPSQDNRVLQEWEKGYTFHDKVLRPAKVAVGKMVAEDV